MTTIGIFDSGIGGLSLVEACEKHIPEARILYVADTAHQPYGQKTAQQVLEYSGRICDFFQAQRVQAILVACSTASAVAVPALQKSLKVPVFGLLQTGWVEETLRGTRHQRIGILATTLTTQTGMFAKALEQKASPGVQIFGRAAPELIDLISEGRVDDEVLLPAIRSALGPLLKKNIDALVIGCTHFNFILPQLQHVAGGDVQIVNPRDWAVKALPLGVLEAGGDVGTSAYFVTGDVASFQDLASRLWRPNVAFQSFPMVFA